MVLVIPLVVPANLMTELIVQFPEGLLAVQCCCKDLLLLLMIIVVIGCYSSVIVFSPPMASVSIALARYRQCDIGISIDYTRQVQAM